MSIKSRVIIIGSGGHAHVVASTLMAKDHTVVGFYDDDEQKWGNSIFGIPVIGSTDLILSSNDFSHGIIAIGKNEVRKIIAEKIDIDWISVIHPFAWVHPETQLGVGTIICAGAIVQPGATIGSHVIANTKASIDHHCQVGDYVHMAVSHLAGGAIVEEGGFMALGSTVLPGVRVGSWATVGAGSVVTKEVIPGTTVVGVPARQIKSRSTSSKIV